YVAHREGSYLQAHGIVIHAGAEDALVTVGYLVGNGVSDVDSVIDKQIRGRDQKYRHHTAQNTVEWAHYFVGTNHRHTGRYNRLHLGKNGTRKQNQNRHRQEDLVAHFVPEVVFLNSKVEEVSADGVDCRTGVQSGDVGVGIGCVLV